jgi:hypothetical protein
MLLIQRWRNWELDAKHIIKSFLEDLYGWEGIGMYFVCLRGILIRDGKFEFNDNKNNDWNDTVWVFHNHYSCPYDGTVDSGNYFILNPMRKEGAAYILPGVTTLRVGLHRGREALIQAGDVRVYRDTTRSGRWEEKYLDPLTATGINLHAAHDLSNVGKDSAGCTVPKLLWNSREWTEDIVGRAKRSGQRTFPRVFIEPKELALYIGEKYNKSPEKNFAHILYENNQDRRIR